MLNFKNLLVAVDGSQMDNTLVPYTHFLIQRLNIEKVFFVSVIRDHNNVPDEILKQFPDLMTQAIKKREEQIKEQVLKYFVDCGCEIEYKVVEENISKFLMEFSTHNDVDLVVMGRKLTIHTDDITIPRMARRATTNLLIIPEGAEPKADKFLVPVDFSEHSKLALQYSFELASLSEKGEVVCQNVISIPKGYHTTGHTKKEFARILCHTADKQFKIFVKDIPKHPDVKMDVVYNIDKHDCPAEVILLESKKDQADWIFLGAKGRSGAVARFIGSFAEKIIHYIADKPLFIARPKGHSEGLLEYLRSL